MGAALDLKFRTGTYIGIQAQRLRSDVDNHIGVFEANLQSYSFFSSTVVQRLNYNEPSIVATVNQLLGDEWSIGVSYQFTHSDLNVTYPGFLAAPLSPSAHVQADLHQVTPYILFNHPTGFFARADAPWYAQHNYGDYNPPEPGDTFYQVNLHAGYQFPRQHGSFTVGLLNVNGTDYRLNPLNPYLELPRSRVWSLELRLSF
jgi:hypothetical protein